MLEVAVRWAMVAALVPAAALAWRRREHRPIAGLVLLAVVLDPTLRALAERVLAPAAEAIRVRGGDPLVEPWTGWARAWAHVYQAGWLMWGPAVAAVVATVFGRRAWPAAALWVGAMVVLVLGYEHFRGHDARVVYMIVNVASALLGLGAMVSWMWERRSVGADHASAVVIVLCQFVSLLVFYQGPWGSEWDVARVALFGMLAMLTLIEGGALCFQWLWQRSSSSR